MTQAEHIYEKYFRENTIYDRSKYPNNNPILAAIQEAFNVNATRIAELEKINQELRERHYNDTTNAYEAGHEDGFYEAIGVSIHVYSGSHDYYTKNFNNEKS